MEDNKKKGITVTEVVEAIEEIAPVSLQESWDNSGLLIGFEDSFVDRLLTCLEVDMKVVDEAIHLGAGMIVTHHPLIFGGIKKLHAGDPDDKAMMKLVSGGISVYSCHTPFDKVKGGNNDIIARMLGLTSVRNLKGEPVSAAAKMIERADEADIGRMGKLKEAMTCRQVLGLVSAQMDISLRQLRFVGDMDEEITMVGVCTGAGADLMEMAAASGCQMFITGDVKYHEARYALAHGIAVIDAGHYGTEKFFASAMKEKLEKKLEGVSIAASKINQEPFTML